jgi:4-hydroxy-3-methylbut-2-enyl diphosphate reductase IspH
MIAVAIDIGFSQPEGVPEITELSIPYFAQIVGGIEVALRGLGASNTLVLLNGRRMPFHPFNTSAVNVNTLPSYGIDQIEILRDGASAIYGSDAVGGVVNYVMRRDFRGTEVTFRYGVPEHKGGHYGQGTVMLGQNFAGGKGRYVVVLTLGDVDYVCDYIRKGGDREEFLKRFAGATSEDFDPDLHLVSVGVANQTTMLKSETEELQRRVQQAIIDRDGEEAAKKNFQVFDTICGATQERQDSLFDMLRKPMDVLLVVGGYNSSNTTHLVEIGEKQLPTFFIRTAECLKSFSEIVHFDLHHKAETTSYSAKLASDEPIVVGVTAGASCPNNLIEDTILRVFELRGVASELVKDEAARAAAA